VREASDVGVEEGGFRLGFRPSIEGIRGVAIGLVFAYHLVIFLLPERHGWIPGGNTGVDVFFTLSGFLITSILLGEQRRDGRISVPAFYQRRALRLLPAIVVLLLVTTFYAMATEPAVAGGVQVGVSDGEHLRAVGGIATYLANWFPGGTDLPAYFGHMWSLAIEEQFYLVWPGLLVGLIAVARRRSVRPAGLAGLVALATVAGAAWRAALFDRHDGLWSDVYFRTDARLDQLLLGVLLAIAVHHGLVQVRSREWLAAGGLVAILVVALNQEVSGAGYFRWGATLTSCGTAALILATLEGGGLVGDVLRSPPVRWVGKISYSLYLWHVPVIVLVLRYLESAGGVTRVAVAAVLSIAAAAGSYYLVEAPALRKKDQLEAHRHARA
jgi:peptidoglycan/LPS O-acetylase OafA/YrhL